MLAHGLVATHSVQLLTAKSLPYGFGNSDASVVLLGTTTSMAAASACFLYILSTQFSRTSCFVLFVIGFPFLQLISSL
ncbi:hypothetical protein RchiOBHm_Chr7g0224811 [Rosa chinensis]|uniref:Uncharacterized protein n=1 Tax=Rosa chinensis TaxID=74649 RepID=A0A2P6PDY3_ROSCH|nr:hypothetical protein RchiOBHm_Chr7g0224811 [Rosa chinensis]